MPSVHIGTHKFDMINLTLEIDILLNFTSHQVKISPISSAWRIWDFNS